MSHWNVEQRRPKIYPKCREMGPGNIAGEHCLLRLVLTAWLSMMVVFGPLTIPQSLAAEPVAWLLSAANTASDAAAPSLSGGSLILRQRGVRLKPETFHLPGIQRSTAPSAPRRVGIELFDGKSVIAEVHSVQNGSQGGVVWLGHVEGDPSGRVVLAVDGNKLVGVIETDDQSFRIEPDGDGVHALSQLRNAVEARGEDDAVPVPPLDHSDRLPSISPVVERDGAGNVTMSVAIVWTARARERMPTLPQHVDIAVSYANDALRNSGAKVQLALVHTGQVSYAEANKDSSRILQDMADGVAEIAAIRSAKKAALVAIIADFTESDVAGRGYVLETADQRDVSRYGYSVVAPNSYGIYRVYTHETGHNLGSWHDRYTDDPGFSDTRYNFGYANPDKLFRGMMSYNTVCAARNIVCLAIPYFSTPAISFRGTPVGVPAGSTKAADSVRRINELAPYIAAYGDPNAVSITPRLTANGLWTSFGDGGRGVAIEIGSRKAMVGYFDYDVNRSSRWRVSQCDFSDLTSHSPYYYCWAWMQMFKGGQTVGGTYRTPVEVVTTRYTSFSGFGFDPDVPMLLGKDFKVGVSTASGGSAVREKMLDLVRFPFGDDPSRIWQPSNAPENGWWWNPSEGGTGLFIEFQSIGPGSPRTRIFLVAYYYDEAGNPTWYTSYGDMANDRLYQGSLYGYQGGADFMEDQRTPTATAVGTIMLEFDSNQTGIMIAPNGRRVPIQRFRFE